MTMTANLHNPTKVEAYSLGEMRNHSLQFHDDRGNHVTMFVPSHVALAVADAFDRAMKMQPVGEAPAKVSA